jgi:hypothetical protein
MAHLVTLLVIKELLSLSTIFVKKLSGYYCEVD